MGKEFDYNPQFNSAENSFIEFVEANVKETETNNFRASLSMSEEQMTVRLNDLMEKHELYKVDRSHASPRIQKAWEIMDKFVAGKWQFFQDHEITPVVYGSVTFDDPAHLDFDLALVGVDTREGIEKDLEGWVKELQAGWKAVGTEGHITYTTLEKLDGYAKAFQEDKLESVEEEDYDIFLYLFYGASVLIGNSAYRPEEKGKQFKEKYLEIVKQSPSLLAYTIYNLEESLIERETRRAGVGDHQTGEDHYKQKLITEKLGIDPVLIAKLRARLVGETEDEV